MIDMNNLYIHIPFCRCKCDYCAFYSESGCTDFEIDKYIDYLHNKLSQSVNSSFETVYIGGGTPSLLNLKQLQKLMMSLHKFVDMTKIKEFSIESNPETLNIDKILLLQDSGVSRLSMGVQSFNERHRETLGRATSSKSIENAISEISRHPFRHFNIDLIYGIPGESVEDFAADIARVKEAGCDHFSAYNLTLEEQTALAGEGIELDENAAVEMYEYAGDFAPFQRYEISNYALSEKSQCLHNINVWKGDTLLGIGPSAASFDGVDRWTEVSDIQKVISGTPPEVDRISPLNRQMEIFAVNLRTVKGWTREEWEKKFPFSWNMLLQKVDFVAKLYPDCWIIENDNIRLSGKGLLFWNEISMELL